MAKRFTSKDNINFYLTLIETGELIYYDGGLHRTTKRLNGTKKITLKIPERIASKNSRGYMRLSYEENGIRYHAFEHRVIFALHHGVDELYKHECIDHIDGNKSNNRIENLRGLSIKENTKQAESLGLFKRTYGELNGMHILTDKEVEEIRDLYRNKRYNQYELGSLYNVSQSHVSNIVAYKKRRIQSEDMTLRSKY